MMPMGELRLSGFLFSKFITLVVRKRALGLEMHQWQGIGRAGSLDCISSTECIYVCVSVCVQRVLDVMGWRESWAVLKH